MGNLPKHSSTVPLVLNPETGAITAQFHVVFDNWFATVAASESDLLNGHECLAMPLTLTSLRMTSQKP
jgi:hypothetical protein